MSRVADRVRQMSAAVWPGLGETSVPPDFLQRAPAPVVVTPAEATTTTVEPASRDRRLPPGIRHVGLVVTAVYAALADPLVGADEATREQRTAQVRRAGMVAAGGVLTAVLIYAVFPVRTYLDQRAATQRAREQVEVISQENERLAEYLEDLREAETVEEIARRDYGMVFPGEEPYAVLPPPAETTTTAPTTTVPTPP
jgi:cell division protein FtsB